MAWAVGTTTTGASSGSSTVSFSHTVPAGTDRVLVVAVSCRYGDASGVTAITYAGQTLTSIAGVAGSNNNTVWTRLYALVAPPVGTDTVAVTMNAGRRFVVSAVNVTGIDQINTVDESVGDVLSTSGATASILVPGHTGNLALSVAAALDDLGTTTVTAAQTQDTNSQDTNSTSNGVRAGVSHTAGDTDVTASWTVSPANAWSIAAVSLRASAAAGGGGSDTPPAYLQSRSVSSGSVSGSTQTLAYSSALTSGSFLLAICAWQSSTQTCTVSDSANGAWAAIGAPLTGVAGESWASWRVQAFYKASNASTGTPTVTMTCSGANNFRLLAILEYQYGTAVESSSYAEVDNTNTAAAPSRTPAVGYDGAVAFCITPSSISAVSAGYTARETVNWGGNWIADDLTLTSGVATQATFTTGGTTPDQLTGAILITGTPGGGGGGAAVTVRSMRGIGT